MWSRKRMGRTNDPAQSRVTRAGNPRADQSRAAQPSRGFVRRAAPAAFLAFVALSGCGGGATSPSPTPSTSPTPTDAIQITGRERFGWGQVADSIAGLSF